MKKRLPYVLEALKHSKTLNYDDKRGLVELIHNRDIHFRQEFISITRKDNSEGIISLFVSKVQQAAQAVANITQLASSDKLNPRPPTDDVVFCAGLDKLVIEQHLLRDIVKEFKEVMLRILKKKIERLSQVLHGIKALMESQMHAEVESLFLKRRESENELAWKHLKHEISCRLASEPQNDRCDSLNYLNFLLTDLTD
jgi:hypothetical protein